MIEINRLIWRVKKELADAEWNAQTELADALRRQLDMLEFKRSIGETHEQDW